MSSVNERIRKVGRSLESGRTRGHVRRPLKKRRKDFVLLILAAPFERVSLASRVPLPCRFSSYTGSSGERERARFVAFIGPEARLQPASDRGVPPRWLLFMEMEQIRNKTREGVALLNPVKKRLLMFPPSQLSNIPKDGSIDFSSYPPFLSTTSLHSVSNSRFKFDEILNFENFFFLAPLVSRAKIVGVMFIYARVNGVKR